jgi:hypothetical protein
MDLLYSGQVIEKLFGNVQSLSLNDIQNLKSKVFAFGAQALFDMDSGATGYYLNLDKRLFLSDAEKKFLIGESFRETLQDVVFISQQIEDRGILKAPVSYLNREKRVEEAKRFSLIDYMQNILLPEYNDRHHTAMSLADLSPLTSFAAVADSVRNNPKVFLMHNEDDFLISPAQLQFFEEVFGDRAMIYPYGGHLGNLWYQQNRSDVQKLFSIFGPGGGGSKH